MRKPIYVLFAATVLLIVSLACGLPSALPNIPVTGPTLDANAVETAILQTMEAARTQTAGAVVPASPSPTLTPEPSLTPTATLSPTPLATVTPLVPLISVSVNTNCRAGPGRVYDRVGALMVGETAEVVGRDPTWRYWYIKNPDQVNGYCWVWDEYATVTGNVAVLPQFTPPPTPTPVPSFEVHYDDLDSCVGWWVELQLTNTGVVPFKSMSLTIRDTDEGVDVSMSADKFTDIDGCLDTTTEETLDPGRTVTVSTPVFAYNPKGHKMRATVTLCTATGQNGMCVTQVIKFKP
ncbi:MAG: hypothetical protein JW730_18590 [Anaerolineales bacterium]|nr:hypothetical protein [Anaerolineales bacterium]